MPDINQESRDKKVIVALFLILSKALNRLPLSQRKIEVLESEIRNAWGNQTSPVRILSEMRAIDRGQDENGEQWVPIDPAYVTAVGSEIPYERVFFTKLESVNLGPTGKIKLIPANAPFPKEESEVNELRNERKRIFDLE
jgi:hypothetical protein